MTTPPLPSDPAPRADATPDRLPYDPPTVQAVKLTDEAAESLT